jgi:hypothetical protein
MMMTTTDEVESEVPASPDITKVGLGVAKVASIFEPELLFLRV